MIFFFLEGCYLERLCLIFKWLAERILAVTFRHSFFYFHFITSVFEPLPSHSQGVSLLSWNTSLKCMICFIIVFICIMDFIIEPSPIIPFSLTSKVLWEFYTSNVFIFLSFLPLPFSFQLSNVPTSSHVNDLFFFVMVIPVNMPCQHGMGKFHKTVALDEELQTINSFWARESQSPSGTSH